MKHTIMLFLKHSPNFEFLCDNFMLVWHVVLSQDKLHNLSKDFIHLITTLCIHTVSSAKEPDNDSLIFAWTIQLRITTFGLVLISPPIVEQMVVRHSWGLLVKEETVILLWLCLHITRASIWGCPIFHDHNFQHDHHHCLFLIFLFYVNNLLQTTDSRDNTTWYVEQTLWIELEFIYGNSLYLLYFSPRFLLDLCPGSFSQKPLTENEKNSDKKYNENPKPFFIINITISFPPHILKNDTQAGHGQISCSVLFLTFPLFFFFCFCYFLK